MPGCQRENGVSFTIAKVIDRPSRSHRSSLRQARAGYPARGRERAFSSTSKPLAISIGNSASRIHALLSTFRKKPHAGTSLCHHDGLDVAVPVKNHLVDG